MRDATDPDQIAFEDEHARAREARTQDLWRMVLSKEWGREFLYEVLLPEVGYLRHIDETVPERMAGQVALHNLGCRWVGKYLLRHRDLYLQMVTEATKREAEARSRREAREQEWTRRQEQTV